MQQWASIPKILSNFIAVLNLILVILIARRDSTLKMKVYKTKMKINIPLKQVERAIATINSAVANQYDWEEIQEIVDEAKESGDPVAQMIRSLNLGSNQITLSLKNPYETEDSESESDSGSDGEDKNKRNKNKGKGKTLSCLVCL